MNEFLLKYRIDYPIDIGCWDNHKLLKIRILVCDFNVSLNFHKKIPASKASQLENLKECFLVGFPHAVSKLKCILRLKGWQINQQGEEFLHDPKRTILKNNRGGIEIYSQSGRGVYFRDDGTFRGFIEYGHK